MNEKTKKISLEWNDSIKFHDEESSVIIIDLNENFGNHNMYMWISLVKSEFNTLPDYDFHIISKEGLIRRVKSQLNSSSLSKILNFLKERK